MTETTLARDISHSNQLTYRLTRNIQIISIEYFYPSRILEIIDLDQKIFSRLF